jgi:putative copper resistance protein D
MDVTKPLNDRQPTWFWLAAGAVLTLAILLFLFVFQRPQETPPEQHMHDHEHMSMSMPMPMDHEMSPARQAKLLADKKESEFNHHLAGFFVVLAGVFILYQGVLAKRWPGVKYAWPACFLLAGIFVLVWSDTELWPFGHREWLEALRNNREVLQHKTFAVLLLALGVIEWRRASGALKAVWSGWVFPVLAIGGSSLLLFHQHEGGMHGANHMELMARIQSEHLSYAMTGIGIGLAKGLAEVKTRFQGAFGKIWPVLMIVLGVLLMFYQE